MKKKVCVLTTARSEYGLLRWVIDEIYNSKELELNLVVTGGHLSEEQGYTIKYIEEDNYPISAVFDIEPFYTSKKDLNKSMSICQEKCYEVFSRLKPDILLVLGDRLELLPICFSALIYGLPIAHIAGGDITEGALDNRIRNSVTMLSNYHFPGTQESADRIKRMINTSSNIYVTGETNLDNFTHIKKLDRNSIASSLGIDADKEWILCTYHSETTISLDENIDRVYNLIRLFSNQLKDYEIIITKSNIDYGGIQINKLFEESTRKYSNIHLFSSLGQQRYISILYEVKFMIGNSSSGIFESPFVKLPVVNIGNRQLGRLYTKNIVNSDGSIENLVKSLGIINSEDFKSNIKDLKNPYGDGNASKKIVDILKRILYV